MILSWHPDMKIGAFDKINEKYRASDICRIHAIDNLVMFHDLLSVW